MPTSISCAQDKVESIDRMLRIEGAVDDEQKKRMAEIAERTPVTLTLKRSLEIRTTLALRRRQS